MVDFVLSLNSPFGNPPQKKKHKLKTLKIAQKSL